MHPLTLSTIELPYLVCMHVLRAYCLSLTWHIFDVQHTSNEHLHSYNHMYMYIVLHLTGQYTNTWLSRCTCIRAQNTLAFWIRNRTYQDCAIQHILAHTHFFLFDIACQPHPQASTINMNTLEKACWGLGTRLTICFLWCSPNLIFPKYLSEIYAPSASNH